MRLLQFRATHFKRALQSAQLGVEFSHGIGIKRIRQRRRHGDIILVEASCRQIYPAAPKVERFLRTRSSSSEKPIHLRNARLCRLPSLPLRLSRCRRASVAVSLWSRGISRALRVDICREISTSGNTQPGDWVCERKVAARIASACAPAFPAARREPALQRKTYADATGQNPR